jgi:protein-tyrosine-phosphatase
VDDLEVRARRHAALGDRHRLAIVDALELGDRTPTELRELTGLPSNLLAFHLDVLEDAGLVARRRSLGDARRRYVTRCDVPLDRTPAAPVAGDPTLLFVCSRNAARSQLAAALWRDRTGAPAGSAGADPADRVHPLTIEVARRRALDLGDARPRGYDEVDVRPDLVVSVCDRAREGGIPFDASHLHWSVPDPSGGDLRAFEEACDDLAARVDRLARAVAA